MLNEEKLIHFGGRTEVVRDSLVCSVAERTSWTLQRAAEIYTEIAQGTQYPKGVQLWACDPPHPNWWVLREVVADLLA